MVYGLVNAYGVLVMARIPPPKNDHQGPSHDRYTAKHQSEFIIGAGA
jgi:hypothetical protein